MLCTVKLLVLLTYRWPLGGPGPFGGQGHGCWSRKRRVNCECPIVQAVHGTLWMGGKRSLTGSERRRGKLVMEAAL